MSDYGAILTAFKRDESSFSSTQLTELSKKLKKIIRKKELINVQEEKYSHKFERLAEEPNAFCRVSEYYFHGEDELDAETLAETKELESEDVAIMLKKLSKHFPKIIFEAHVGEWR